MSLERFRRSRMVILNASATAYQAARAMDDNHIGAVLVSSNGGIAGIITDRDLALAVIGGGLDPHATRLSEIMSEEAVTCDLGAGRDEAVRLMREHGVRRIPLVENGKPVGIITFDDLVVDAETDAEALRSIITAQLEVEAPQKPAGVLHPTAGRTAQSRGRALMRAKARAEATYNRMLRAVADATGLDRDRAERGLITTSCMLCRRLSPQEAMDLAAQLPLLLQRHVEHCADGPDRAVTTQAIENALAGSLNLTKEQSAEVVRAIVKVICDSVSPGQIKQVRGQLPEEMKPLIPTAA